MTPVSDQQIDEFILTVAHVNWRKVAMIIGRVMNEGEIDGIQVEDAAIAARIRLLVREGKLEGQGNLCKWRHSEVRLPSDARADAVEIQDRSNKATGREAGGTADVHRLSSAISGLLSHKRIDQARSVIQSVEPRVDPQDRHALIGMSASIEHAAGDLARAIELMRQATSERPDVLSHWSGLADYLMDDKMWQDAILTFDRLISLSEEKGDSYFLDDARLRKMLCLRKLGRDQEIKTEKAKLLRPDVRTWMDGRLYSGSDFD
jgi:tetratricopeptide (TPR) repeat protein